MPRDDSFDHASISVGMHGFMLVAPGRPPAARATVRALPSIVTYALGIFVCVLPRRYWGEFRKAAFLSGVFTAFAGVILMIGGYVRHVDAIALALGEAALRTGQMTTADLGHGAVAFGPISFLFTPIGLFSTYVFVSGVVRSVALAAYDPYGDPILEVSDWAIRSIHRQETEKRDAAQRLEREGVETPDAIETADVAGFANCDFVLIASRKKDGWTKGAVVHTGTHRLTLGEPIDRTAGGKLRTVYPLTVKTDLSVDRRVVNYEWPEGAPELPPLPANYEDEG